MPTHGPLVDRFGRVHTDLRLSITDRCNLRCVYCLPDEKIVFRPRAEILTFEEIARIARVARSIGVRTARITGGEPLVRKGVVELVSQLSEVGFDELAMTTNGTGLAELARPLAEAGLTRVNVSCDSLRNERYAEIRRRGELSRVLESMGAAEAAGLRPVKINVVLIGGVNDDEVLDFAIHARETGRTVRFIEFMPLDATGLWSRDAVVPSESVLATINDTYPLVALDPLRSGHEPADRFRFADGAPGEIGVIASVTRAFCGACNRLRLTADGAIRNCLFSDDEVPIRDLMRAGGSDEAVALEIRRCVWGKHPGHGINDPGFLKPVRSMSMIGG
ncbi:MAG: GTP 3',8-cyclase MoaA [Acidimicrobiales bacterium]